MTPEQAQAIVNKSRHEPMQKVVKLMSSRERRFREHDYREVRVPLERGQFVNPTKRMINELMMKEYGYLLTGKKKEQFVRFLRNIGS